MAVEDRIHAVVDPIIEELDLELVDLVYGGGRLKVTIDQPDGLGTEVLTKATRMISHEMDLQDPISGTYTLEVSSPGLERPLRTPAHYARSLGEHVAIKLKPNDENLRRVKGTLTAATDAEITVDQDGTTHTISYDRIAKAKTVFDWGPPAKSGGNKQGTNHSAKKGSES